MRLIINLVLIALTALLIWVLISSISEPIKFQEIRKQREDAVIDRLIQIREAQEIYRNVEDKFASSFDSLIYVLKTGKVQTISVFGDPDDPSNMDAIRYDTTYSPAIDKVTEMNINLDSLPFVPYSANVRFEIEADTLTYQSTLVDVVEVGVLRKKFMGQWGDPRFARYDNTYDPNTKIKFGSLLAPNTSGNWER